MKHVTLKSTTCAVICGLSIASLLVTAAQGHAPDPVSVSVEKTVITGSSIKRIEGETALPVQVLTREDVQRTLLCPASMPRLLVSYIVYLPA